MFRLNRVKWEVALTTIPSLALHQLKLHAMFIFDMKQEMVLIDLKSIADLCKHARYAGD